MSEQTNIDAALDGLIGDVSAIQDHAADAPVAPKRRKKVETLIEDAVVTLDAAPQVEITIGDGPVDPADPFAHLSERARSRILAEMETGRNAIATGRRL